MTTVNILTLLSSKHKEKGRYGFSVEIVPKKKTDSVLKAREKEGYVKDGCLTGSISPVKEFPDSKPTKPTIVKFTIDGSLKASFASGENELDYNTKSQSEARREFVAEQISDSKGNATITFTLNDKFMHKVTITDICQPGMSRSMSTSSSYVEVTGASRPDSISSNVSSLSIDDNQPQSSSEDYVGGGTNYSNTKQEALPLPPSGPTVLSASSSSGLSQRSSDSGTSSTLSSSGRPSLATPNLIQFGSSCIPEDTADYHLMINDSSLATLASVISPSEASQLISHLGITTVQYQTIKQNNPHNILAANKEALIAWRNTGGSDSWENPDNSRRLVEQLLGALAQIGRNDVRKGLKTVMESPRALKREDFQHA